VTLRDDQIVKVQSMNASPYVKPFAARAADWQTMMFTLQVRPTHVCKGEGR
jgi:dynein heavy chain